MTKIKTEALPCALQQIVSKEQASKWVLNPAAHLNQIAQDVATGVLVSLDVHQTHRDQEIPANNYYISNDKLKFAFTL